MSNLQEIPGVDPSIEKDLLEIGIKKIEDLKGQNPETLYKKSCLKAGQQIDRCLLYVYRCAVYYASTQKNDPEKLKWWNWKD